MGIIRIELQKVVLHYMVLHPGHPPTNGSLVYDASMNCETLKSSTKCVDLKQSNWNGLHSAKHLIF